MTEMAELLNTSVTNIKRAFRGESLWFKNGKYKNQPELVLDVMNFYSKHGKPATVDQYPGVNVKCIIDRPEYYGLEKANRQKRWTDEELIEAARMAGLVSPQAQAKYFNRPGARAGSIKSLWTKRFGMGACSINGMNHWMARELVNKKARYIRPVGQTRKGKPVTFRRVCLWVDMEKSLKTGVPPFLEDAIKTMANFQRWLHASNDPKPKILKMIKDRELSA